mgnify:CR=1 FL=1
MPFTKTEKIQSYKPDTVPVFEESKNLFLESELDKISRTLADLEKSVREIQTYLESNP